MASVLVLGLGRFGSSLARELLALGHQVLAVDASLALVNQLKEELPDVVQADIKDKEALAALGARDVDVAVVAVGNRMDASILACLHLKELGVPRVIAKVSSDDHMKILQALGLDDRDLVYPEQELATRLAHTLSTRNIMDSLPLEEGYSIVTLAPPASFIGKTLKQLALRKHHSVQVVAVKDTLTGAWNPVPSPDALIKDSDQLLVLGGDKDLDKLGALK
jgi:trk system potassium uptake protein TrkA